MPTTPPNPSNPAPGRPARPGQASGRPNTLNLHQRDLAHVLDELDRERQGDRPDFKRGFLRWPFRHATVRLDISSGQSALTKLPVACRNLSRGGVSVLHSAYMHVGTRCVVHLPHPSKGAVPCAGEVVRCTHRTGVMHEIGIRFAEPINVREFVRTDPREDCFSLEMVKPEELEGAVVYADPSELDQKIVKHFLRETPLRLSLVAGLDEAVQRAADGCDLFIVELSLVGPSAEGLAQRLRAVGAVAPIIVISSDTTEAARRRMGPPAVAFIHKPLSQSTLFRALGEFLIVDRKARARGASPGAVESAPDLVQEFAQTLPAWSARLADAVKQRDAAACRSMCLQMGGTAPTLGFAEIGVLAREAADSLEKSPDFAASTRALHALSAACEKARVPKAAA